MASSGQMTPQAPQSMQRAGSMKNAFFGSPLIAWVGQRFSQAVQPVQFSATIVKGMLQWVAEARCTDKQNSGLLLHHLQDLVLAALLDEAVVAQRLAEADPCEKEHQDQHAGDRDVVGLQKDVQEPPDRLHAAPVQRRSGSVNRGLPLAPSRPSR